MQKRLMSIALIKSLFAANGWECKSRGKIEYCFTKTGENDILVPVESDNRNYVNVIQLLNNISCDMRVILARAAADINHGIDVYIDRGNATDSDIRNLLDAISELNIILGGGDVYPEVMLKCGFEEIDNCPGGVV